MTRPTTRVLAVGIAGAACLALAQAPASAAPAFTDLHTEYSLSNYVDGSGSCSGTTAAPATPPNAAIPENGSLPVAASTSRNWKSDSDATDTATASATINGVAKATGSGTTPKSIELAVTGHSALTPSKPAGFACSMRAYASVLARYDLTTTQPLIATLSYDRTGPMYAEAYLTKDDDDEYEELYGYGLDGSGSSTVYLPAGHYRGYVQGQTYLPASKLTTQLTGSANVRITFTVPGSTAVAATGKARKLVTLPTARNCAAHTVTPSLTTKAKKLKKAKRVVFSVNGKKAATLKGKKLKKGKAVSIAVADKGTAKLDATVTLKNGKKVTASATYHPCA